MPEGSVGDIILCVAEGSLGAQRILSTFHYRITSPGSSLGMDRIPLLDEVIDEIVDPDPGLHTRLLDVMPTNYTLHRWTAQFVSVGRSQQVKGAQLLSPGASGLATGTTNLAAVIVRRGELGTRYNVGALHVPYPDANVEVTTGVIPAAYLSDLDLLADKMLEPLILTSTYVLNPILYNRTRTPNFTLLTDAFPQDTVRTMRSRTVGKGV